MHVVLVVVWHLTPGVLHAQDVADLIALVLDAIRFGQLDAVTVGEIATKYGLMETQVDQLILWMTAGDGARAGENDLVRGSSALEEGGTPGLAPVPDVLSTSMSRLSGRTFDSMAMSPLTADITCDDLVAVARSEETMAVLKALRLMQEREAPGQVLSYISAKRDLMAKFGGLAWDRAKPHVQTLLRDGVTPIHASAFASHGCKKAFESSEPHDWCMFCIWNR